MESSKQEPRQASWAVVKEQVHLLTKSPTPFNCFVILNPFAALGCLGTTSIPYVQRVVTIMFLDKNITISGKSQKLEVIRDMPRIKDVQ